MSFVIFDTEYTSWKGCQEHGWTGAQKKEIVQIAAVKVSEKFEVLDTFNQLCKPTFNPVLSDYFVNLTKITNEQVERNGISFEEAYRKFNKFVNRDVCFSHSWGSDYYDKSDGAVFDENLDLYGISERYDIVFRNIAAVFKELYLQKNIAISSQSSGEIVGLLKIEENLKFAGINPHNALYDVFSILEGLRYFKENIVSVSAEGFILK